MREHIKRQHPAENPDDVKKCKDAIIGMQFIFESYTYWIFRWFSTDCFMLTLQKCIAIRGPVRTIKCDHGTDFVGPSNEFNKLIVENRK